MLISTVEMLLFRCKSDTDDGQKTAYEKAF